MPSPTQIKKMFESLGTVQMTNTKAFDRENPLRFSPEKEVAINCAEVLRFTAWTYERFNGVRVVRIDAETTKYSVFNLEQVQNWVLEENGRLPFATIRVRHEEGASLQLLVTHSIMESELTKSQLEEALISMTYVWTKCVNLLDNMDPVGLDNDIEDDEEDEDFDEEIERAIEQFKNERDANDIFGREGESAIISVDNDLTVESVLRELHALVGLQPVKDMVSQLTAQQEIAKMRAANGLRAVVPSPHLVFLGNPGTGKTTVARLVGKLYKALGLLTEGHVVEADRSSLVAGYIGQTALKTRDMCKKALGGVLFIDEAYSLSVDGRDFGMESIEALLTFMEAHRGNFVVVVAGYPDRMFEFLNSNPGLKSRFDLTLDFPDYSTPELMTIFENLVTESEYELTDNARKKVSTLIDAWPRNHSFGNGREVRRLFGSVVGNHAAMLARKAEFDPRALRVLTAATIPTPPAVHAGGGPFILPGYL
jgi:SpoVK/Ycf46/Vps4 family AAA+-type ATPase